MVTYTADNANSKDQALQCFLFFNKRFNIYQNKSFKMYFLITQQSYLQTQNTTRPKEKEGLFHQFPLINLSWRRKDP
jgi:hypothetical protein